MSLREGEARSVHWTPMGPGHPWLRDTLGAQPVDGRCPGLGGMPDLLGPSCPQRKGSSILPATWKAQRGFRCGI